MAYIGREPQIGNFQVCDAISVVNGQAAYTMQVNSVNVSPETANHVLCSLNGVLQKPGSSFTVSGSTITFASNLVTGDVIDFIHILGSVLDLGVPSDDTVATSSLKANSVTAAKLNADIISGSTELASEPADTDEFLVSDAGVLKRIDYSLIKGGGLTGADQWRLTASLTADANITSNLERPDHSGFGYIGTGMSVSSGIFTFPSTGIWSVRVSMSADANGADTIRIFTYQTNNNSSYSIVAAATTGSKDQDDGGSSEVFVDVTDVSNVKVQFAGSSIGSGSDINGATDYNRTSFTFVRLGDT